MQTVQTQLEHFNVNVKKDTVEVGKNVTMLTNVSHQHTRAIGMVCVQTRRGHFTVNVRSGILVQACNAQISMNVLRDCTIAKKTPCALIVKVHLSVRARMAMSTVTMAANVGISTNVDRTSTAVDATQSAKTRMDHFSVSTMTF